MKISKPTKKTVKKPAKKVTKKSPVKRTRTKATAKKKLKMLSEHAQQSAFISWCRSAAELQTDRVVRHALLWVHAIPNGYLSSIRSRMKAIQEGVRSGIADIFMPIPQMGGSAFFPNAEPRHHGLYIEFKVPGNKLSETQQDFCSYCYTARYKYIVVYNWQEAAREIVSYLNLQHGTYREIGESEYEAYLRIRAQK